MNDKIELEPAEWKLIEAIRNLENGEIGLIKIQNGLPVYFKIELQAELFDIN